MEKLVHSNTGKIPNGFEDRLGHLAGRVRGRVCCLAASQCDQAGHWLLTDTEQAQQQLEQERQAKEQAQTQVLQAAQNLLATGMDLAQVAQIFNLSEAQAEALRYLKDT